MLSEALAAGVPALVSDQGALPERVRESGAGLVVRSVDEAVSVLGRLDRDRGELARLQAAAATYRHRSLTEMAACYRPLYDRLLGDRTVPGLGRAARGGSSSRRTSRPARRRR